MLLPFYGMRILVGQNFEGMSVWSKQTNIPLRFLECTQCMTEMKLCALHTSLEKYLILFMKLFFKKQ